MFPVVHLFPLVVSQYYNHVQLNHWPLADPDVPLSSIRLPANHLSPTEVMRNSRVSIVIPSLCTDDAQSQSRVGLAAFPTPALPGFSPPDWMSGFIGTMQPSDSLKVICLPCLFHLSGILGRS